MSDTDNESAFESADEGDDDLSKGQAALPQPSPPSENQGPSDIKVADQDDDVKDASSDSQDALPQEGKDANEKQAAGVEIKNETIDVARAAGLLKSTVDLNSVQDDEGLGDWDAGWEVDEDVLASNSSGSDTQKCDDSKETSQEIGGNSTPIGNIKPEGPRSGGDGDGESQMKEGTPTRKIERSANKERVLDKLCEASGQRQSQASGWGWGSWGTSILSTATSSMSTFTTQVGHGLNSVLESVEATLGAPTPEELAAQQLSSKESDNEEGSPTVSCEENAPSQSFLGTPLALSVGSISSKVITGSLDTLELIGRKTMDILQEGDPGFKKKRSLLKTQKTNLSEVLREAKERESEANVPEGNAEINKINFGTVFDDCQGLVHLEALEMLSKQCEQRIQVGLLSLMDDELIVMQRSLENIKETYESQIDIDGGEDLEHDFDKLLTQYLESLNVAANLEKLLKSQSNSQTWFQECTTDQEKGEKKDAKDIHAKGIYFMAEFTARAIEIIHKMSELIMVMDNVDLSHAIQNFACFANVLCTEVSIQSSKYSSCLSTAADDSEDPDSVNPLITNVFLEASNSSTYIQDACHLIVPIFQLKPITAANDKHV